MSAIVASIGDGGPASSANFGYPYDVDVKTAVHGDSVANHGILVVDIFTINGLRQIFK